MASANDLYLTVRIDSKNATAQMSAVTAAVEQAGARITAANQAMSRGVTAYGNSVKSATREHDGLSNSVRAFVREERQEDRLLGYFVRNLGEIAPMSELAKAGLLGLGGVMLGGFGLGAALDAMVIGGKLVMESFTEQREKATAYATALDAIAAAGDGAESALRRFYAERAGVGAATAGALKSPEMTKMTEEEQKANARLRIITAERRKIITDTPGWEKLSDEQSNRFFGPKLDLFDKEHKREIAELTDIIQGAAEKRAQVIKDAGEMDKTVAKDATIQSETRVGAIRNEQAALTTLDEVKRTQLEKDRAIFAIDQQIRTAKGPDVKNLNAERAATVALYDAKIKVAEFNRDQKQAATVFGLQEQTRLAATTREISKIEIEKETALFALEQRRAALMQNPAANQVAIENLDKEITATRELYDERLRVADINERATTTNTTGLDPTSNGVAYSPEYDPETFRENRVRDENARAAVLMNQKHKDSVDKLADAYTSFGHAGVNALMSVAFQSQNVEEAVLNLTQQLATQFVNLWVQQSALLLAKHQVERAEAQAAVTRAAGEAGAKATAQSAGVLGPAAPASGASVAAATSAMFQPLASAAGGWKVPRDTLALVHKDEHVLPARIARNYEGNGPSRGSPSVNVYAMDGASVDRVARDHSSKFNKAIRSAQRESRG